MQQFDLILKYFSSLKQSQQNRFAKMKNIYEEINKKVNLISRKDIQNLYEHHVLHSLSVAKIITFTHNEKIIDIGTGGGFPGIPLAILFPENKFTLIDSILKKIKALNEIIDFLQLKNVETECSRSENILGEYDIILGRAVANIDKFIDSTKHLLSHNGKIIYLNGYNDETKYQSKEYELKTIFTEDYFLKKKITIVKKSDII